MKTPRYPVHLTCALLALISVPLRAVEAGKSHVLFLGTDLDLQQGKDLVRVQGVDRRAFLLKVGGREVRVPMKATAGTIRLVPKLKLSEIVATVENLRIERAFSAASSPMTRMAQVSSEFAVQSMIAAEAAAAATREATEYVSIGPRTIAALERANAGAGANPPTPSPYEVAQRFAPTGSTAAFQNSDLGTSLRSPALAARVADDHHDAIEVAFDVSSARSLANPYVVITAHVSAPEDQPEETRTWIYATELKPITNDSLHVRIKEVGLPRGYQLHDYQLHLYNNGQEVGTTVAEKRVELTRDEAFEYVLLDHLVVNKGRSVSASRAIGQIPPAVRDDLQRAEIWVKVDKDGSAGPAFADAECREPIESEPLAAALRAMRFKPALHDGKPVGGVAWLKL